MIDNLSLLGLAPLLNLQLFIDGRGQARAVRRRHGRGHGRLDAGPLARLEQRAVQPLDGHKERHAEPTILGPPSW